MWNEKNWFLYNGFIHELNPSGDIKYISHFEETTIHLVRDLYSFYSRHKTPKQMDSSELKTKINTLDKGGINTTALEVEYHFKKKFTCRMFYILPNGDDILHYLCKVRKRLVGSHLGHCKRSVVGWLLFLSDGDVSCHRKKRNHRSSIKCLAAKLNLFFTLHGHFDS